MADRLGVMNAGELQQVGTPEEVYLRPQTRFVASFLGAINWIGDIGVRPEAMRIAKRAGIKKAKVALARKLAVIMHRMLADGTLFTNQPA